MPIIPVQRIIPISGCSVHGVVQYFWCWCFVCGWFVAGEACCRAAVQNARAAGFDGRSGSFEREASRTESETSVVYSFDASGAVQTSSGRLFAVCAFVKQKSVDKREECCIRFVLFHRICEYGQLDIDIKDSFPSSPGRSWGQSRCRGQAQGVS